MNKAFVREPDAGDEHCPRCHAIGQPVQRETLVLHLAAPALEQIAGVANFCPTPTCEVAYFDAFERFVPITTLLRPVYPKNPDAPLCPCFGLTCEDIEQDIDEGVVTRTRACVTKAQSPEARCHELSPTGRSCVLVVQRYYMQHRQP